MHPQEASRAAMNPSRKHRDPEHADTARPQKGDVMITRESHLSSRYTIRQLPHNGQLSALSRDDAVLLARQFAQMNAVNVWYSDDTTLRLLEAYRSGTES